MKHTPILIISIKNSQRINILKEKLDENNEDFEDDESFEIDDKDEEDEE